MQHRSEFLISFLGLKVKSVRSSNLSSVLSVPHFRNNNANEFLENKQHLREVLKGSSIVAGKTGRTTLNKTTKEEIFAPDRNQSEHTTITTGRKNIMPSLERVYIFALINAKEKDSQIMGCCQLLKALETINPILTDYH